MNDPQVMARARKITAISVVLLPALAIQGALREGAPETPVQWFGSAGVLGIALYAEPAIYVTMRWKYRFSGMLAFAVATIGPVAIAWFWLLRWFIDY